MKDRPRRPPGESLHFTLPRDQITVNPDLWQHKLDRTGAGQALAHIKTRDQWDPQAVRDVYLYRFPDGHVELMDGHSRENAGDRVGVEGHPSVIFDGNNYSVEDARATAALINIKRQTGTVVDSSKAMRDLGLTVEDLAHYGADPNAEHTRIAIGLSKLSDGIFTQVAQGNLPSTKGAIIGELLSGDQDAKNVIYKLIQKKHTDKNGNISISDEKLKNDIRFAEFSKVVPTKQGVLGRSLKIS